MKPSVGSNEAVREIGEILMQGWLNLRGTPIPDEERESEIIQSNPLAMRAKFERISTQAVVLTSRLKEGD